MVQEGGASAKALFAQNPEMRKKSNRAETQVALPRKKRKRGKKD